LYCKDVVEAQTEMKPITLPLTPSVFYRKIILSVGRGRKGVDRRRDTGWSRYFSIRRSRHDS